MTPYGEVKHFSTSASRSISIKVVFVLLLVVVVVGMTLCKKLANSH